MDLWLREGQVSDAVMTYKVKQTLIREKTKYQDLKPDLLLAINP